MRAGKKEEYMPIKKLQHSESGYWSWEYENEPHVLYFTNDKGQGVFRQKYVRTTNQANECDKKQIVGTSQFSLSGYSMSGARAKINKGDFGND
jgi:hypothetical protein